jgi:hypothetical protein
LSQPAACNSSLGPCFDREVFRKNLQYLSRSVLPEGWKLNAVATIVKVRPATSMSGVYQLTKKPFLKTTMSMAINKQRLRTQDRLQASNCC